MTSKIPARVGVGSVPVQSQKKGDRRAPSLEPLYQTA